MLKLAVAVFSVPMMASAGALINPVSNETVMYFGDPQIGFGHSGKSASTFPNIFLSDPDPNRTQLSPFFSSDPIQTQLSRSHRFSILIISRMADG